MHSVSQAPQTHQPLLPLSFSYLKYIHPLIDPTRYVSLSNSNWVTSVLWFLLLKYLPLIFTSLHFYCYSLRSDHHHLLASLQSFPPKSIFHIIVRYLSERKMSALWPGFKAQWNNSYYSSEFQDDLQGHLEAGLCFFILTSCNSFASSYTHMNSPPFGLAVCCSPCLECSFPSFNHLPTSSSSWGLIIGMTSFKKLFCNVLSCLPSLG